MGKRKRGNFMVLIDKEKCIGCGLYCSDCPSKVIVLENKKVSITQSECLRCGHCVAICPVDAFKIDEYDMSEIEEYGNKQPHLDEKILIDSLKSRRSIRKDRQIYSNELQDFCKRNGLNGEQAAKRGNYTLRNWKS
jgi:ferredoxin